MTYFKVMKEEWGLVKGNEIIKKQETRKGSGRR